MEAKHNDIGKCNLQYILSFKGLDDVAAVGDFGAEKYDRWNYKSGASYMRFLGSCVRHIAAVIRGEDLDTCQKDCIRDETKRWPCVELKHSGLRHLAHVVFDCLMLMDWLDRGVGNDDRYKEVSQSPNDKSLPY